MPDITLTLEPAATPTSPPSDTPPDLPAAAPAVYRVPHGPDEPCTCPGCWACDGFEMSCTCDIDWDAIAETRWLDE